MGTISSSSTTGIGTVSVIGGTSTTTIGTEQPDDGNYTEPCYKVETDNPPCFDLETYIEPCFVVTTETEEFPNEDDAPEDELIEQLKTFGINVVWDVLYFNGSLYVSGMQNATPALDLRDQYAYVWRFSVWTGLNGGIASLNYVQFSKRVVDEILGLNPASAIDRNTALGGRFSAYGEGNDLQYFGFKGKILNTILSPVTVMTSQSYYNGWVMPNSQKVVQDFEQNANGRYVYYKTYLDMATGLNVRISASNNVDQVCNLYSKDYPNFPSPLLAWYWICKIHLKGEYFNVYMTSSDDVVVVRGNEFPAELVNEGEWNEILAQHIEKDFIIYVGKHQISGVLTDLHTWDDKGVALLSISGSLFAITINEETNEAFFNQIPYYPTNYIYPDLDGKPFLGTLIKGKFLTVTTWTENDWQQDAEGYYYLSLVHQRSLATLV